MAPGLKDALLSSGGLTHSWSMNGSIFGFRSGSNWHFWQHGQIVIRGPRYFDTDLGLLKNTKIDERVSLQFQGRIFYNSFNNVNLAPLIAASP